MDDPAEEDFGLSSSDEADLVALTDATPPNNKRKLSIDSNSQPVKKAATEPGLKIALESLRRDFGLDAFRLEQERAIARLLSGCSATVVFPTGGGKSLVFQLPALVFEELDKQEGRRAPGEHGVTLVVSPLIALMKDQVDALLRRGIKAAVLDSTKTRDEFLKTSEMLRDGELKLLYCAPERLNNEGFIAQMASVRGGVRMLAVDEAHCISEWGHAFRPDYLSASYAFLSFHASDPYAAWFHSSFQDSNHNLQLYRCT